MGCQYLCRPDDGANKLITTRPEGVMNAKFQAIVYLTVLLKNKHVNIMMSLEDN